MPSRNSPQARSAESLCLFESFCIPSDFPDWGPEAGLEMRWTMNKTASAESYLGVICLHCKKPVPLIAQPADKPSIEASEGLASASASAKRVFLAWCHACNREAPYSATEIVTFAGPAPMSHFHPRSLQAMHKAGGAC
jgi:hypothetical protein